MRLVREASSVAMVATTRMADYGSWAAYFRRNAWRRLGKGLLRPVEKMKPIHRSQNLSVSSFAWARFCSCLVVCTSFQHGKRNGFYKPKWLSIRTTRQQSRIEATSKI